MSYLHRPRTLLLKSETTYGTPIALAPSDVMVCRRIAPNPQIGEWRSRELVSTYDGASPELLVGKAAGCDFDFEAAGSGPAGTRPKWGDALLMCGFAEAVATAAVTTYTPVDAGFASATLRWRIGASPGLAQTVAGARGALSFTGRAKDFPFFTVSAVGKYEAPASGAAPTITSAMLAAFKPPVALEPSVVPVFTWGGKKLCFSEFSFSDGRRPTTGSWANCDAVDLGVRSFTGRMVVRMEEPNVKDLISESASGLLQPGVFTFGTAAGNILTIEAPAAQLKFAGFGEVDSALAANIDIVFTRPGSEPEISIKVS